MAGHYLTTTKQTYIPLMLIAVFGLIGCDDNRQFMIPNFVTDTAQTSDTAAPTVSNTTELVERDIEAPDVFQITEKGLWDGRPSLGGVWVAHSLATDPERVVIRNTANGKFVIGALFRHESEEFGPPLQISSDAADALGLIAGAPALLNVTALRREEAGMPLRTTATTNFDAQTYIAEPPYNPMVGTAGTSDVAGTDRSAPTSSTTLSLAKPFIQIGIFNIEANARRTAEKLRSDGILSRVLAQKTQGRSFWRVIVGPAPNEADRAIILSQAKKLGFADAYFVTN